MHPSPSAEFAAEEVSRRKNWRKTDVNEKLVEYSFNVLAYSREMKGSAALAGANAPR